MDLGAIFSRARKATLDNSPLILTAIGVTGSITTAVLAYRAGMKAQAILDSHHHELFDPNYPMDRLLPKKQLYKKYAELTWKTLVPPIGSGIATVTCIVMANRISVRRSAALASAYMVMQEGFAEYKTKVVDRLGEEKERAIRDEIAQDRVVKNPPSVIIASNVGALCLDAYSGRYFNCDMETIRAAVNTTNFQILSEGTASLTDFWDLLGLARTSESDELGWNTDTQVEVEYSAALHGGKPVLVIGFRKAPISKYYQRY
jgi:hypothetical protein